MRMIRRFRRWFIDKYLRAYVSESNREDIEALKKKVTELLSLLDKERAYSAGLEYACRQRVKINIEKGG